MKVCNGPIAGSGRRGLLERLLGEVLHGADVHAAAPSCVLMPSSAAREARSQ
jgi:hypothetical protein